MDEENSSTRILRIITFAGIPNITKILMDVLERIDHPYFELCLSILKETGNKTSTNKRYKRVINNKAVESSITTPVLPDKDSVYYQMALYLNATFIGTAKVKEMGLSALEAYSMFLFCCIEEDVFDSLTFIDIIHNCITDKKTIFKYEIIQLISEKYKISGKMSGIKYNNIISLLKKENTSPMKMYLTKLYEDEMSVPEFIKWFVNLRSIEDCIGIKKK